MRQPGVTKTALLVMSSALLLVVTSAHGSLAHPRCDSLSIPVSLAEGMPATESVYAELCLPSRPTETVHLMVTPSAANHRYWDPTYRPDLYSNIRALNRAGYVTLNIDAVGSGGSSHPPSALVTVDTFAFQVHQLIGMLRAGEIGGIQFDHVVTHGLSNGALTAIVEAARYEDVDALVLQGMTKPITAIAVVVAAETARPAFLHSQYAGLGLDPGYVAFEDRFYDYLMLSPDGYEREPAARLYEYRDTTTMSYLESAGIYIVQMAEPSGLMTPTRAITVPLLVAVGSEDLTMCAQPPFGTDCTNADTVRETVEPLYPNAERLDTYVLPGAGHVMNLALNARDWFDASIEWFREVGLDP